jgi:prophage regulatory protein
MPIRQGSIVAKNGSTRDRLRRRRTTTSPSRSTPPCTWKTDFCYLIPWPKLAPQVPYTRQHIWRLEEQDKFPRRVQAGPNRVCWWQDEVDVWLSSRQRGARSRPAQLGPKARLPIEPDPADLKLLRELAAKLGLELVPTAGRETKRKRGRLGAGP